MVVKFFLKIIFCLLVAISSFDYSFGMDQSQLGRSQSAPITEEDLKAGQQKAAKKKAKRARQRDNKKAQANNGSGNAGSASETSSPDSVSVSDSPAEQPKKPDSQSVSNSPAQQPKKPDTTSPVPLRTGQSPASLATVNIAQTKPLAKPIAQKPDGKTAEKKGGPGPKRPATDSPSSQQFGRHTPHKGNGRLSAQQQKLQNQLFAPIPSVDYNALALSLHHALRKDEKQALQILEKDAKEFIKRKDDNGWAAIHYAAANNRANALARLVALGADINDITNNGNAKNEFGHQTPLLIAARCGYLAIVKYLLLVAPGISKQPKPSLVYQSYHRTMNVIIEIFESRSTETSQKVIRSQHEVIKFLLEHINLEHDKTAYLHAAAYHNCRDLLQFAISKGVHIDSEDNWNGTALLLAAYNGHLDMVKTLLDDHKASIDKPDKEGKTPLLMALHQGHTDTANFLLERGADVTLCAHDGISTIHCAAKSGLREITERLLKIFEDKKVALPKNRHGFSPVHDAAQENAADIMRLFVKSHYNLNEPIHAENEEFEEAEEGKTPLIIAADNGSLDVVQVLLSRELLETKKVQVNYARPDNYTALLAAFLYDHPEIVKLLLAAGADISVVHKSGGNALHYMALHDSFAKLLAETLEKHANLNVPDKYGFLPLHYAARDNAVQNITVLAKKTDMNTPITATEESLKSKAAGKTPMMLAAEKGSMEALELLLDSRKCDINQALPNGMTALYGAVSKRESKTVDLLLQNNANAHVVTKKGTTLLHAAARHDDADLMAQLIRAGLSKTSKNIQGATPLHIAARWDSLDAAQKLCTGEVSVDKPAQTGDAKSMSILEGATPLITAAQFGSCKVMKYLLSRGAKVSATTKLGFYPLYYAADNGHLEAAQILLEASARIDLVTKDGFTALDVAAYNGSLNIINLFVEHLAKLNKKTVAQMLPTLWAEEKNPDTHQTPLILAVQNNQPEVVKLLLQTKIDPKACEKNTGRNALHYAAEKAHEKIVEMLLDKDPTLRDIETFEGETALTIACKHGHFLAISVLAGKYQAPINDEHGGDTPLTAAIQSKNSDRTMGLLLALQANPNRALARGFFPLHIAAQYNDVKAATLLDEHKAVLTACTPHGVQAIHTAARHGSREMLEFLCKKNISIDEPITSGDYPCSSFSPLMMAVLHGQTKTVRWLLEHKANVRYATPTKTTALHIAAQKGFLNIVTMLCIYHADPQAKNNDGHIPLSVAPGDKRALVENAIAKAQALGKAQSAGIAATVSGSPEQKGPKQQKDTGHVDAKQFKRTIHAHDDSQEDGKESAITPILSCLSDKAQNNLEQLDTKIVQLKIIETITTLLANEALLSGHIKKLTGHENLFRIKVGKKMPRIIYYKDPKTGKIAIVDIEKRSKAYRNY